VKARCPGLLRGVIFGLLSLAIGGPELGNLRVRQVEDLGRQEQITLVEAVGPLPLAFSVLVAALDRDAVRRTLRGFVAPDGCRDRVHRDLGGWFCGVGHSLSFRVFLLARDCTSDANERDLVAAAINQCRDALFRVGSEKQVRLREQRNEL
jgi:hypothetical protein